MHLQCATASSTQVAASQKKKKILLTKKESCAVFKTNSHISFWGFFRSHHARHKAFFLNKKSKVMTAAENRLQNEASTHCHRHRACLSPPMLQLQPLFSSSRSCHCDPTKSILSHYTDITSYALANLQYCMNLLLILS